jgi:2C-methyl-D-erythritol 2,4-cyclodiphosphate synthase
MQTHKFYKEDYGGWYIDLPQYLEAGGSKADLAMVAGADTMLDIVAEGNNRVAITMATEPFEGADKVQLLKLCEPSVGGGYYLMSVFEGRAVNQEMWLCGVTEFVFGTMPEEIYLKRRHV